MVNAAACVQNPSRVAVVPGDIGRVASQYQLMKQKLISSARHPEACAPVAKVTVVVMASLMLLLPALYNGFPLVFPDTGAYFSVAWGNYWTLDRSGFYGFFYRPLSHAQPLFQLWVGIAVQSAAIAVLILLVAQKLVQRVSPIWGLALVAVLAVFTSVAWHSSQLMPDAFSAATVLLAWLASTRRPSTPGTPLLWFAAFLAGLTHNTHVVLLAAAGGASLLVQWWMHRNLWQIYAKRGLTCAAVVVALIGTQLLANGAFLKSWSAAPLGSMFLFARLHEDGLIQPWLARHCPQGATPNICRLAPQFPRDSQKLLWAHDSPLRSAVRDSSDAAARDQFLRELQIASVGSIRSRPVDFAAYAFAGGVKQFLTFQILDDECPEVCRLETSSVLSWFSTYRPSLLPSLLGSRQLQGTIPKTLLRAVTTPVSAVSLLLLPILLYFAWRRRDVTSTSLLAAVFVSLIANAFVTGGISDVHDRYQSRLIWLATLSVLLVILRFRLVQESPTRASEQRASL